MENPFLSRRRPLLFAFGAALVTLGLGAAFVRLAEQRRSLAARDAARALVAAHARQLEGRVERALTAAGVLASVVSERPPNEPFDALAAEIVDTQGAVESLALSAQGVVTRAYPPPLAGETIGLRLAEDPLLRDALERARQSREPALVAPIAAGRRGVLAVGIVPLGSAAGTGAQGGALIVTMGLTGLVRACGLERLPEQGYEFALTASGAGGGRSRLLARSSERELRDPVSARVEFPGGEWTLALAPRAGWRSATQLAMPGVLAAVFALLAGFSAYHLLKEPELLRREVEVRQRRLSAAHRELQAQIVDQRASEERLRHDAAHDVLTGLPNRAAFAARVQTALEFAREHAGFGVAVLFVDVDRFKYVNERYGHAAGDALLLSVAARLRAGLRPVDELARVGGDEFGILLYGIDGPDAAAAVAGRLLAAIEAPFEPFDPPLALTVSVGLAMASRHQFAEDLLHDADRATFQAKSRGRARLAVFDDAMRARTSAALQLEAELRRAVEREEFVVHYQPIVALADGRVSGFEALVRWRHPVRGQRGPAEFIPLAEQSGLIVWIDRQVLAAAARQLHAWQERFAQRAPLSMSVNLSGRQLSQPNLVEHVAGVLAEARVHVASVKIEITESVVMESLETAAEILGRLRALGVRLSIDDFGTGYSSLSYLDRLPFDTLKIDQSFVKRIPASDAIVRTILKLAGSLGMDVIAEGVEEPGQLAALRELGCGYAQGYLFARPLPAEEAEALLAADPRW